MGDPQFRPHVEPKLVRGHFVEADSEHAKCLHVTLQRPAEDDRLQPAFFRDIDLLRSSEEELQQLNRNTGEKRCRIGNGNQI